MKSILKDHSVVFGQFPSTSAWYWGPTKLSQAKSVLRSAVNSGITAVDTSPCYGWGSGEELIGDILGNRNDVTIMTKCGLRWEKEHGEPFLTTMYGKEKHTLWRDLRPESIRRECEASLKRLGRDVIDVYVCHWPDPLTPFEESMGELLRLRDEGKIREIGISNWPADSLPTNLESISVIQVRFNALKSGEIDVLNEHLSDEVSIHIAAYAPLEQGLLGGSYLSERQSPERDQRGGRYWFREKGLALVREAFTRVEHIYKKYDCTPAQLALAAVFNTPLIDSTLVGMREQFHIDEVLDARQIDLSEGERRAIFRSFRRAVRLFRKEAES